MADFTGSLKKIIPSAGETRVLLGWGLATAVLVLLQYVVFSLASGAGVSSGRLPVVRMLGLGAGAYVVLMIRDLIAYYAGVSVDEMFTLSPVVVFGILAFMVGFLLYAIHDIQNVGTTMVRSSRNTGGNLLSFFFEDSENFEDEEEEVAVKKVQQKAPSQTSNENFNTPPPAIGLNHYGPGTNPFERTKSQGTRTGASQGQDIRNMVQASETFAQQHESNDQPQGGDMGGGDMMGGGVSSSGLGFASF
jgi:uncharacterized membrane protein YgcG